MGVEMIAIDVCVSLDFGIPHTIPPIIHLGHGKAEPNSIDPK